MIRQGHAYDVDFLGRVVALEAGGPEFVRCLPVPTPCNPNPHVLEVRAACLQPAPMRYFHGETPA